MRHTSRLVTTLMLGVVLVLRASAVAAQPAAAPAPPRDAPLSPQAEALWEAARKGDAPAVKKLVEAGVDVNTKFRYGATALSYACDRGHLDVVRVLLERGADANVKDTFYGATPLSWASGPAQTRKPEHALIVGLLLKHGARGQDAALGTAVGEDDEPMVRIILEHGGLSAAALTAALEAARKENRTALVEILEKAGAKPAPVANLTAAQLARCAGSYVNAGNTLTFEVKDGKLQGGPPGQSNVFVPRDETTFALEGVAGLSIVFAPGGDQAASLTVKRGDTSTVYTRVEGK